MHDLLRAIKDKYRIYVFTKVDQEGSELHAKAQKSIGTLISEGIIQDHRAMYCTTLPGMIA